MKLGPSDEQTRLLDVCMPSLAGGGAQTQKNTIAYPAFGLWGACR